MAWKLLNQDKKGEAIALKSEGDQNDRSLIAKIKDLFRGSCPGGPRGFWKERGGGPHLWVLQYRR